MNRRQLLGLGLALAAGLVGTGCSRDETPAGRSQASADILFAQTLPDTDGASQSIEQWRGQALLVNFWATWCAPCVKEMPDLDQLQAEFPDVRFVGIGIDSAANIARFIEKVPVSYPLLEARATGLELMRELGNETGGLPFTVLVGSDGNLIRSISGQIDPDDLRASLRLLPA